jgi:hypothetical protein
LRPVFLAAVAVMAAAPRWTEVGKATFFRYEDNRAIEASENGLRGVYEFPKSAVGCHPASGCLASCTYADTFPWFVNAGGADLTGTHPYRNPSTGSVAGPFHGVVGIEFTGSLDGRAAGAPADYVWEVVFFHEQKCYSGGNEFGFRRDAVTGAFQAYWSINSNCGLDDHGSASICRSERGAGPHVEEATGAINIHYATGVNRYRISTGRDPKDGRPKFLIEIFEPYTATQGWRSWVDPNAPGVWFRSRSDPRATFPIDALAAESGYITAGIQRSATDTVKPDRLRPPAVRVRAVRIAHE